MKLPGGIKPEEFDYFHELIAHQETARIGAPGFADSISSGYSIGLPPIFNFGSPALKAKVVPEVLSGKKRICLAITEPYAGSDVARIRTTATRTADGKHFIINGVKKWITNGTFADYFTVAAATDKGITMFFVERSDAIETKQIKTSYSTAAGTSYITFENVKVPVENILGKEGKGFQVIMYNFNHERWYICGAVTGATRLIVEECFKWAHQRKVFGKRLIDQPVIRNKLAAMVAQLEACENWLENITYQMCNMPYLEQSVKLAGPIALLKYQVTRVAHNVSDDACQIFGGRGITKTGMGRNIEAFQRTYKVNNRI
jgi:alkylation response protein AidB-like acyl-CoA dehydrogenase